MVRLRTGLGFPEEVMSLIDQERLRTAYDRDGIYALQLEVGDVYEQGGVCCYMTGEALPADCRRCGLSDSCWGCRSRAYAAGNGVYGKDPRCFRGKSGIV